MILKGGAVGDSGSKGRKEFKALMESYADEVKFVSIDSSVSEVQGLEAKIQDWVEGVDRAVMFTAGKEGEVKARSFKGNWHRDEMGGWVREGFEGDLGTMLKVEGFKVKTRSKRSREMGKKRVEDLSDIFHISSYNYLHIPSYTCIYMLIYLHIQSSSSIYLYITPYNPKYPILGT